MRSLGQQGVCTTSSLPWTSAESSASARICLIQHHDKALEGIGTQESRLILKALLLQAQEQCISTRRKSGKTIRRPVLMNKEFLDKFSNKKEACRGWKQGQVGWEKS